MKKVLFLVVIVLSVIIINSLVRSIYDLWRKQDLLARAKIELEQQKQENQRLKSQFSTVQKEDFVEKEARNKLFLVKPGEQEVIIPKELLDASTSAKPKADNTPNWKKWWDLFF